MDYQAFVDGEKTLLIAPAGYGKTYTIVESLKHTIGRQLILTHTHAGVASIKEKIKKANIASNRYNVETISSFAQKYVNAFYTGNDIPDQEKSKEYHPFIIDKVKAIFKLNPVKDVMRATYTGLFVDEYQDCNKHQHEVVLALSESLKTHILGDPLQGIFDFNGDLVDFDTDLSEFERMPDLSTPERWYQEGNNRELGDKLKEIRKLLEQKTVIDLSANSIDGLHIVSINQDDFRNAKSAYRQRLNQIISNCGNNSDYESLLIITPEYEESGRPKGNIQDRAQIKAQIDYGNSLILLEAIDDRNFYALAKKSDELIGGISRARKKIKRIKEDILEKVFNKTELNKWFNDNDVKNKRDEREQIKANILKGKIDSFIETPSPSELYSIIIELKDSIKIKYKRAGFLYAILKSLKDASLEKTSVDEAMKNHRNIIRRSGRKIIGKCIGTTLLTKGLEFDTVAILDAHKFNSPKHLYVALTRCCKRLIIFTNETTLSPYKENSIWQWAVCKVISMCMMLI